MKPAFVAFVVLIAAGAAGRRAGLIVEVIAMVVAGEATLLNHFRVITLLFHLFSLLHTHNATLII